MMRVTIEYSYHSIQLERYHQFFLLIVAYYMMSWQTCVRIYKITISVALP